MKNRALCMILAISIAMSILLVSCNGTPRGASIEYTNEEKTITFRHTSADTIGESFGSIAVYGKNQAYKIYVGYSAEPSSDLRRVEDDLTMSLATLGFGELSGWNGLPDEEGDLNGFQMRNRPFYGEMGGAELAEGFIYHNNLNNQYFRVICGLSSLATEQEIENYMQILASISFNY